MADLTRREFVKASAAGAAGIAIGPTDALRAFQAPAGGKTTRIAVIGAGVAGLTAAYTLKQLGYTNVIVFEKEVKPGGKVLTDTSLGTPIEMGAVFATDRYEVTLQLAREVGAPTIQLNRPAVVLDDDGTFVPAAEFAVRKHGAAAVEAATARYKSLMARYRIHERRGFAGAPPELHVPFADFVVKHDIVPFADTFRHLAVAYGCAYYEDVPALYYLKALAFLGSSQRIYFPQGYQDLWIRLAGRLDVRCSSDATAVTRSATPAGPRIEMKVGGQEMVFDRLIIATPATPTTQYLDLTSEERDLFARVVNRNYQITVAAVDGIAPDRRTVYSYPSSRPSAAGRLACWYDPAPPKPIYAAYQVVGRSQSDEDARRLLREDFQRIGGGTVNKVLLHRKWDDYFAHVETAALADGFYDRFEALQGKNGTLFATGLLSLEGVETAARYARDLVKEHFAAQPVT